jgi:hypothetical protein
MFLTKEKIYSEARLVDNSQGIDDTEVIVKELERMGRDLVNARASLDGLKKQVKTFSEEIGLMINNIKEQAQGVIDTCEKLSNQ